VGKQRIAIHQKQDGARFVVTQWDATSEMPIAGFTVP
jgi:hypothetical protein